MNLEKLEEKGIQHAKLFKIVRILWYICKYREVLASDIEERFEISHTTLYRYINEWERSEYIEKDRLNGQSQGRYIVRCAPKLEFLANKVASEIFSLLVNEFIEENRDLVFSIDEYSFKKNDKTNKQDRNQILES